MLFLLVLACDPAVPPSPPAPAAVATPLASPAPVAEVEPPADPVRAAADQAFNDAMRADQAGAADAPALVARAREAYGRIELDSDGLFHLALLEMAAGEHGAACKTAERILVDHPDHLLAIGACARAATRGGDTAGARVWQERFVAAWDRPREALPEFDHHDRLLPILQREAVTALTAP
jgi:hypothetical protein